MLVRRDEWEIAGRLAVMAEIVVPRGSEDLFDAHQ